MRKLTSLTHYKQDYHLTQYFLIAIHILVLIGLSFEYFVASAMGFVSYTIQFIFLMFFFNLYYRSLKELLYSFWGMSLPAHIFLVYSFLYSLSYQETAVPSYIYLTSILIHWVIFYILSSPVFFPRMRWWEYDFRFRADLPLIVQGRKQSFTGRLTDLRRGGGGFVLFEDIDVGQIVDLEISLVDKAYKFQCVIISSMPTLPGRGYSYGVRFLLKSAQDRKNYYLLRFRWSKFMKSKLKQRLARGS